MPVYHFASPAEASAALDAAWEAAEEVSDAAGRDDAYSRGVPVKIRRDGLYT